MSSLIEIVYQGADNPNTVKFYQDNVLMDFSSVTRMVLTFFGAPNVVDTDISPSDIDWSGGSGVVEFNLNDVGISPGAYSASLKVYDLLHANGQILAHPKGAEIIFRFV